MSRPLVLAFHIVWLVVLWVGPAHAHGLPVGGLVPFIAGGEVIGAGTTWGIVLQDEGRWLRSCEEGSGATARFYHRATDGRIWVASDAGLFATADGGCTYEAVSPVLEGQVIGAMSVALRAPQKIFVATRTPGVRNGVFRSEDEGAIFTATPLAREGTYFDGIITTGDGQTVLVHALDFATLENILFVSRDGGESFDEAPAALADYVYVRLLGPTEDAGGLVVAALPEAGGNVVLSSDDGFASAAEIVRLEDEVTGFARVGDVELLTLSGTRLLRRGPGETTFEQVLGPTRCLSRFTGLDTLFACGSLPDNAHLLSTTNGLDWAQHVPYLGIEERQCPEGTPGFDRCMRYIMPEDAGPAAPQRTPPQNQTSSQACSCFRPSPRGPAWSGWFIAMFLGGPWFWHRRANRGSDA